MIENHFAAEVAANYDASLGAMGSPQVLEPTVEFLAELAGDGGYALELAIGTGRVALPLNSSRVSVSGIELSHAMIAQLRSKPGGTRSR